MNSSFVGSFLGIYQPMVAAVDPWIVAFSAITVIVTVWMGFRSAKTSKTASDFFVAGRSVGVGMNASAISGEYLSAASFMGVAGMVMAVGYDALWYPVCYACGYLFLLLFIAGPLRRFGAYTIPDFAEGRFDSPIFRKIAVVFVLFIGFFYTMPQMKGAGTTLAYIFQDIDLRGGLLEFLAPHNDQGIAVKGFPYWAGVAIVGAVITLNVALGGMKGITLVQAFQYWAKMFAISVPIFVLMAVHGHYGRQIESIDPGKVERHAGVTSPFNQSGIKFFVAEDRMGPMLGNNAESPIETWLIKAKEGLAEFKAWRNKLENSPTFVQFQNMSLRQLLSLHGKMSGQTILMANVQYPEQQLYSTAFQGISTLDAVARIESMVGSNGVHFVAYSENLRIAVPTEWKDKLSSYLHDYGLEQAMRKSLPDKAPADSTWLNPFGPLTTKAAKAAGITGEDAKPYSLLYTYSLIIALVCGTAGLPHILVRFYTNPDGVAAKKTTMWVMILIGIFYVFPPVFGVMGRNLMPELYAGVGAKGTDKIVLELPMILAAKYGALGPILSGITCAGAFAAFMSTFSGLLVSMTGALAHDVYGRILKPSATAEQRLRAFKYAAVIVGGVAVILGTQVEKLQINFMVGQAFGIAAASYFPLLFMAVWWRKLTMKGAATGMLTGGMAAVITVTLTNFSDLGWVKMGDYWAAHPLLRILCEQPAIWTVPLAIGLMIVVSKLTASEVPADIRMKMLVLHAPEKLGLKQEYIQEHQQGH